MTEYIDRQEAIYQIREAVRKFPNSFYNGIEAVRSIIRNLPAADVAPVRHGRWKVKQDNEMLLPQFTCSECGATYQNVSPDNYCGNCGAKMDGAKMDGEK